MRWKVIRMKFQMAKPAETALASDIPTPEAESQNHTHRLEYKPKDTQICSHLEVSWF